MNTIFMFLNFLRDCVTAWICNAQFFFTRNSDAFLVNLITSAIDIIITVGVIDALINRQEKNKWKPAKGLLLSDLLNITDELIFELLPKQSRKINPISYKFGNTITTTTATINKQDLNGVADEILKNINYYLNANLDIINDVHKQLEYVLRFSSIIMQPILFNHLLKLDRALTKYKHLRLGYGDSTEKETANQEAFIPVYLDVLTLSIDLRNYLIDQSDRNIKKKGKK